MAILLMVIDGYFISGYLWLLMVIILVAIILMANGGYFVIGYWWLLMVIIVVVIGGYYVNG
jgi:hypothetical protein